MYAIVKLRCDVFQNAPEHVLKVKITDNVTIGDVGRLFWPCTGQPMACSYARLYDPEVDEYVTVINPEDALVRPADRVSFEFVRSNRESVIAPPGCYVISAGSNGPTLSVKAFCAPPNPRRSHSRSFSVSNARTTASTFQDDTDSDDEFIRGIRDSHPYAQRFENPNSPGSSWEVARSSAEVPPPVYPFSTSRDPSIFVPGFSIDEERPRKRKRSPSVVPHACALSNVPDPPQAVQLMLHQGPNHPQLFKLHEETYAYRRCLTNKLKKTDVAGKLLELFTNFLWRPDLLKYDFERRTSAWRTRNVDFVQEWNSTFTPAINKIFEDSGISIRYVVDLLRHPVADADEPVRDADSLLTFYKFATLLNGVMPKTVFQDVVFNISGMTLEAAVEMIRDELGIQHPVILGDEKGFSLLINRHLFQSTPAFAVALSQFTHAHVVLRIDAVENYLSLVYALNVMHGLKGVSYLKKAGEKFLAQLVPWITSPVR